MASSAAASPPPPPPPASSSAASSAAASASLLPDRMDFVAEEQRTLALWARLGAFQRSLALSAGRKEFTFYDGPPFATGLPHYGHILAGTIKDVVTRFATQTGHHVSRRFGWDTHGVPVEQEINKAFKIKGREDVMATGIARYNAECRAITSLSAQRRCEPGTKLCERQCAARPQQGPGPPSPLLFRPAVPRSLRGLPGLRSPQRLWQRRRLRRRWRCCASSNPRSRPCESC